MQNIYSVSQINKYISDMFRQDIFLNKISVKGEISNCTYHPSGHIYFTLKDNNSVMAAVMFRSYTPKLNFRLEKGQSVVVSGSINVFERDGKYQLYATDIEKDGVGYLYVKFDEMKKRLEETEQHQ